jgi:hypothetical protein
MLFNVPQFIDIEDKIVGPLTGKQLGWLGVGGVIILILWNSLDTSAFIVSAIIVGIIFGGLAFYRPYNQPLIKFLLSSVHFSMRPKVYVWRRSYDNIKPVAKTATKKTDSIQPRKTLNDKKITEISKILDRR